MKTRLFGVIASILMVAGILFPLSTPADASHSGPIPGTHPMIFVHGGAGSGAQFESQAMRFESNGYPVDYIAVLEYDSTFSINTVADVWAKLDQTVATLLEKTGADQVDILGHSLGTTVMHGYLAFPDRAAKVAHYVNIDGRTALAPPGGVPTLAIWAGRGTPGREIVGATNVTIPNQTHVQSATSAESFVKMYKFFTGDEPNTMDIVPEFPFFIKLAGRAVIFPQNTGVQDATLEVWAVRRDTGERIGRRPAAVLPVSPDGSWGPVKAIAGLHYEFVIVREGIFAHHFYYEPFLRSDYLIRLNTGEPGVGVGAQMENSDHTTNLVITRYKELWGDQGAENDSLEINGVNVINAATSPITKRVIAIFAYDVGLDGVSDVTIPIPFFFAQPFLTGVDLFIPGATPPDATVPVVLTPRGGGDTQVLNIRNWASLDDRITLQFNDYSQDINSWLEYVLSLRNR